MLHTVIFESISIDMFPACFKIPRATSSTRLWRTASPAMVAQAADLLVDEKTQAQACDLLGKQLEAECDYLAANHYRCKPAIATKVNHRPLHS